MKQQAASCALVGLLMAAACGGDTADPRDQWVAHISTDAPLPQLGDRVLVEILDDSGQVVCSGCRRHIGVAATDDWPLSFGIVPPAANQEVQVRVRLYRSQYVGSDGLPAGPLVIDRIGSLPPPSGVTNVSIRLVMGCFGVPSDLAARTTCNPETGQLAAVRELPLLSAEPAVLHPGSWELAASVPCAEEPPEGMACVEGGTFLLGAPRYFSVSTRDAPAPERLVHVGAFALDRDEFSVGRVREFVQSGAVTREPYPFNADPSSGQDYCHYLGANDGDNDALPVNCLDRDLAKELCAAAGKRLPTEAEWEFAAGNRTLESPFPWGSAEPPCDYAIVGRGRSALEGSGDEDDSCRARDDTGVLPPGPVAGGHDADVTNDGIRNLGGNLTEFVQDDFVPYEDNCWGTNELILTDPVCQASVETLALRGGSWDNPPNRAHTYNRNGGPASITAIDIGFRCALSLSSEADAR